MKGKAFESRKISSIHMFDKRTVPRFEELQFNNKTNDLVKLGKRFKCMLYQRRDMPIKRCSIKHN